jgi:hypothetical protein
LERIALALVSFMTGMRALNGSWKRGRKVSKTRKTRIRRPKEEKAAKQRAQTGKRSTIGELWRSGDRNGCKGNGQRDDLLSVQRERSEAKDRRSGGAELRKNSVVGVGDMQTKEGRKERRTMKNGEEENEGEEDEGRRRRRRRR